jgi:protein TonB
VRKQPRIKRYLPLIAICLCVGGVGTGLAYAIKTMLDQPLVAQKSVIQQVTLIRPPPPPPPEEQPPPPEVQEEVKLPDPEEQPTPSDDAQPPPGDQLGLDADGTAGSDGFGLAARRGGRDLIGGGDAFRWYANVLKDDILRRLSDNKRVRANRYSVNVRLWIDRNGAVERVALASTTGDSELDGELERALGGIERFAQAPPADMPQPVRLRIVSRL